MQGPSFGTPRTRRHAAPTLLRSEPMHMLQMIVQADAASQTVEELGELGSVMFCDLNEGATAFQRNFVSQVRDCGDAERCLAFLEEQVAQGEEQAGGGRRLSGASASSDERLPASFTALKSKLEEEVNDMKQLGLSQTQLVTNYNHLIELSHVLQKCDDIFSEARAAESSVVPRTLSSADLSRGAEGTKLSPLPPRRGVDGSASSGPGFSFAPVVPGAPTHSLMGEAGIDLEDGLSARDASFSGSFAGRAPSAARSSRPGSSMSESLDFAGETQTRLGYVTGVVSRQRLQAFERVLFRATRGNMYLRTSDITSQVRDPHSGELVYKSVFIVFFSGRQAADKVSRICDTFLANRYNYPSQFGARNALLSEVQTRVDDLLHVIDHAATVRAGRLAYLASQLPKWRRVATKQKAVYKVLNMWNYDLTRKCLIAEAWVPISLYDETLGAIRRGAARSGAHVPSIVNIIDSEEKPPTYFHINKFTRAFQAIVDGYGVPRYGEINPAAFAIITYPFLFGVMFGDVGHGALVLLLGLYFVCSERKYNAMKEEDIGDILSYPWHGRYVLLLMGAFSVYGGLLYNDVFGLMADLFGTSFDAAECTAPPCEPRARSSPGAVYPFGLDPAWHHAANELQFANSYKMKLSIILGVLQMCLGLFCSLLNALHFRSEIDVWCDFVPRAIFMLSIFGYLVVVIILKWSIDWVDIAERPPSLISLLIDFFMSPGNVPQDALLYDGQGSVQLLLLLLATVTVPWMLLAKPVLLRRRHLAVSGYKTLKRDDDGSSRRLIDDDASDASDNNGKHHVDEFDFAEVMIHQIIHTIEFVLGCISNTASYLRLWALSLAHKQLSAVFYEMILRDQGLKRCTPGSPFVCALALVPAFFLWTAVTVGILCGMELLSAFLHALRLHWVEFMNKFYAGDGRKFEPFSFADEMRAQRERS